VTVPVSALSVLAHDPLIPIDVPRLVATRLLVQANSGGGKSWALRRLLEQTFGLVQHIVIDPDGEYHTLREKYDYVLAGKGGDCPAEVKSASLLARRLLELGVSAIIDISELGADRALFVERFIEAMMDAPRDLWHDVLVVIDEAHKFAPEGDRKATAHAAIVDLMSRGRKRGFCGVLATQRVSKLDKSAAAEVNNKLIGRTGLDVDVERAAKEIGLHAKDARAQLACLEPGQFWVVGPAFGTAMPVLAKVGDVQTTHPDTGASRSGPPTPPRAHVKKMLGQLADLPAEAEEEAKSVEQLRGKVKELEQKLRASEKDGDSERVLELMKKNDRMASEVAHLERANAALRDVVKKTSDKIADVRATALTDLNDAFEIMSTSIPEWMRAVDRDPALQPKKGEKFLQFVEKLPHLTSGYMAGPVTNVLGDLSKMEVAMLTALAQHPEGLSKPKLLLHADYAAGGATSACFAKLVREAWASPANGGLRITPSGLKKLGHYDPLPVGDALRAHILAGSRLSAMEKKLLEVICAAYPYSVPKGEILERANYSAGGATSAAFARLVALDYATIAARGELAAAKELFG